VLKQIKATGLQVIMLAVVSSFIDEGLFLSSPNKDIRGKLIGRMKDQIDLAAELGAIVPIGLIRGSDGGNARLGYLAESLLELHKHASRRNVRLLLEPINRSETRLINTIEDAQEFIETFNLPDFQILLDIYHLNIEGINIEETIRFAGVQIGHIHLADNNRRVPGKGTIDWEKIFITLFETHYNSYCSIEAIPGLKPKEDAKFSINFLKQTIQRLER